MGHRHAGHRPPGIAAGLESAGDRLDLEVALAPCVVGYAEAVARLLDDPATVRDGNPYAAWMEAYSGAAYHAAVTAAMARLERIGAARGAEARYPQLLKTFVAATRLEAAARYR